MDKSELDMRSPNLILSTGCERIIVGEGEFCLDSDALSVISSVFHTNLDGIQNIMVLKSGMTNRSFRFEVGGKRYIIRVPGRGTDRLIDRTNETEVYEKIKGLGLCDTPVYINPTNGCKITRFLEHARTCKPDDPVDLDRCMEKLRYFHRLSLQVSHTFDIFERIVFYEKLWDDTPSEHEDYQLTKENIFQLKRYIDKQDKKWCLTHIDAVADNFLFYPSGTGESLQLTDWEYAGMQDPDVDIAMFCIYSLYNKEQVDRLIDIYFQRDCNHQTRAKIYAYIASCGLLWSNWCEFKKKYGIEFGEYSARQYQFAKDYYFYTLEECRRV